MDSRLRDGLPTAILFDMNDTILEYDGVADRVWRTVCEQFASGLDGIGSDQLLAAIQEHRKWYWSDPERHRRARLNLEIGRREVVEGAFRRLGIEPPPVVKEIADAYAAQREEAVRPFPGALETLQTLRERKVRLALVTNGNGEYQRSKVERFGLAQLFDCVIIEGEFGIGKPDERVYLHALDDLGSAPQEAWMVGDNLEWEVAAPQALGILGIWVDSKGVGLPSSSQVRPDRIIRALPELL